jgi:hypothetical protein
MIYNTSYQNKPDQPQHEQFADTGGKNRASQLKPIKVFLKHQ